MNDMKNKKLFNAIWVLALMIPKQEREIIENHIGAGDLSLDDPWVAAALGCANDADIPDVALEFFIADVKSGFFDMDKSDDMPINDPPASP
jgi:hypothetical protein